MNESLKSLSTSHRKIPIILMTPWVDNISTIFFLQ